ncbi:unnamed protein product [Adineta ricciae]|uniref:B box-type domain-containing protein n=1 Tax=Adineta ricciae TaxID=249248 RepID=A0A813U346_ADIRI|nr:unnamed protein product [Adineta ricciae]
MSFNRSNTCALCTALPSVSLCEGCQKKFCYTCFNKHRNDLSLELDDLFNRRNELMEVINSQLNNDSLNVNPCFEKIDRWQNEMHAHIDRITAAARDTVYKLTFEINSNIRNEFDEISKELQRQQKTNGYIESDLNRLRQQLIKLNDTVQQSHNKIHVDSSNSRNINWDTMLFVATNKAPHMTMTSTSVPSSPNLNNSLNRSSHNTMSLSRHPYSSSTHTPNFYRTVSRTASLSTGSRSSTTYACIGCKTINNLRENGPSFCSVCHSPAPF